MHKISIYIVSYGLTISSVIYLMYVAIKGDVYITTKLMYVATRFQEIQKSRCSALKTAGFALDLFLLAKQTYDAADDKQGAGKQQTDMQFIGNGKKHTPAD